MAELRDPQSANAHDGAAAHRAVGHEASDVNFNGILIFAGSLVATGIVVALLTLVVFRYLDARESRKTVVEYPLAVNDGNRLPPEPRLQTNPRQDLLDLRGQEDAILHSYGWVDKNAGVVRIPIEEAMRLIVQRGLPARPATEVKR